MQSQKSRLENTYYIKVRGVINPALAEWLGEITIIPQENGETILKGAFPDQSSLRGLIDHLWNLNFTIVSVEKLENTNDLESPSGSEEKRQT